MGAMLAQILSSARISNGQNGGPRHYELYFFTFTSVNEPFFKPKSGHTKISTNARAKIKSDIESASTRVHFSG